MKKILAVLLSLFAAIQVSWAADEAIGYVKTVSGEAYVVTAGNKQQASLGTAIYQGSMLQTGPKSSLGVTFKDDTVMSFGPNTQITVDEYMYAPAQGKVKLGSKLLKGTLNYISGSIAKLKPEAVTVATPTGTIGVRGTHFVVTVDESTAATSTSN